MTGKIRFTVQKYYFFCIYQNFFVPLRKIMTKRTVYHIVEWTIALIGCAFLVYKLVTYDDYASLGESLRAMGVKQWSALVLCLLLMPVNMFLEAWKWRTLIPMSWRDAHYQVYYSKLAGRRRLRYYDRRDHPRRINRITNLQSPISNLQ